MQLTIQKWGNSAAVRLPSTMLSQMGASIGDTIEVDPNAIKLSKPKYKLSELIAKCNKDAPAPTDLSLWESMNPVGLEII